MSIADDVRAGPARAASEGSSVDAQFDRTPPQDNAAEQCVLGGMLLSKDAIADVLEILRSNDFYRPAHAVIFDTVLDLYGRGEPADAITVAAALADAGDLGRVGGAPYLHTLISTVPTAANAAYYARIVAERAVLRRLVEAGTRIVQLGYGAAAGAGRDVDDVVDLAQQAVYDVTERRVSEDFTILSELLQPTLDEIEAVGSQSGVMTGIPTGFTDLDRLLNGLHPGQLVIVAGRPGLGKSTASMDFARNASIRFSLASAIFSLEMSKVEIVMRLLAAEARVPLHVLRSGQLSDDDWTKLARRMGEIAEAPLFVDDTPNMTLMEIRAKARRLKQRHDLKLLIVDYLQLMTSPKRVENRQQEVADLSRGLKLLAKEVECPVVAVSQLNRGPEQRTDKRPQLSDLRESGCLTAASRVLRADDNTEATLGDLFAGGVRDIPVWTVDERLRYTRRTLTHVFPSGRRPVFRLVLASGRQIEATANHRFLTFDGWTPLAELAVGTPVGTPRRLPPRRRSTRVPPVGGEPSAGASGGAAGRVSEQVWVRVGEVLRDPGPGRRPLACVADVLDAADLELHATNDVRWDPVLAVEPLGVQDVFDATVLGLHNFVANGIAVHNSIEQDADVVILLHRDDYYDKESPRAGEADFIVAKHRNGPTDTITVAAQLHLSRFVDMAVL